MANITEIKEVNIDELKPYERNAKKHDTDKICASIKEFGFRHVFSIKTISDNLNYCEYKANTKDE